MTIIQATIDHLYDLVPIFDGYRMFYRQKSNVKAAKDFLYKRLTKQDTIIYISIKENKLVGFVQLFPSFSSVSMKPQYILNDLYVAKEYRKQGIGTDLLEKSKDFCREQKAKGLVIQTERTNPAQKLYENLGWKKDKDLYYYWTNDNLIL